MANATKNTKKGTKENQDGSLALKGDHHSVKEDATHSASDEMKPKRGNHGLTPEQRAERQRLEKEFQARMKAELEKAGLYKARKPKGTVEKTFSVFITGQERLKVNQEQYDRIVAWGGIEHLLAIGNGVAYIPSQG